LVVDLQCLELGRLRNEVSRRDGSLSTGGVQVVLDGRHWGGVGRRERPDRLQERQDYRLLSLLEKVHCQWHAKSLHRALVMPRCSIVNGIAAVGAQI
jgi:hypothetical protein